MVGRRDAADERGLAELDKAMKSLNWHATFDLAEGLLRDSPQDADVLHASGLALQELGKPEEGLERLLAAFRADPDLLGAGLDACELLIHDLVDEQRALDLLRALERRTVEETLLAEIHLLRGLALFQLEDLTGALRAYAEAAAHDPTNADVALETGAVLLDLLQLDEAEAEFRRSIAAGSVDPRASQLLAFLLDYTGRREEAASVWATAAERDPRLPSSPPRLSEEEFDQALEKAIGQLPSVFASELANVEVSVQNHPDRDFCRRNDCGPMTLGMYVGTPITLAPRDGREFPDRIILFQRCLENACRDRAELIAELGITLRHEIGHLLGMDESQVEDAGHG
jgi:predicted Zn-dependent protease with MMP-like domain